MCKILHLVEHLYQGGIERLLEQLAKHSPSQQYQLSFYTYQTKSLEGIGRTLQDHGTPVFCYDKPPGYDLKLVRELIRVVRKNKIDVIHTHDFGPMEYAVALKCRFPRLRLVHTHHTLHDFLRHRKYVLFFQFASLFYSKIIGVSPYVTGELARHCPLASPKLSTIFNGLDLATFQWVDKWDPHARTENRTTTPPLRMVNVSRISAEKNLMLLLETCVRLKLAGIPFELHHAGSGSTEDEFRVRSFIRENQLDGHVFLHGFQPDVRRILALGNVFVSPSVTEGHPVAVLEAMSSGLLCVCSDIPAHRLLSAQGIVFFPLSNNDLFEVLLSLRDRPQDYAGFTAKAREKVQSTFSLDRMIGEYATVYG